MAVRKRNEYLDGDESEEEIDRGHESEEEGRGAIGGHASKRQKLEDSHADSDDDSFHSFEDDGETQQTSGPSAPATSDSRFAQSADFDEDDEQPTTAAQDDPLATHATHAAQPQSTKLPKSIAAAEKAARKSGVLYISRVPPFMKPQTLRHYLAPHAPKHGLGRIFLAPESHENHVSRVKRGGNKKKSYTDGWVEFISKKEAKAAAETLNGEIFGGKKGSFYYDDVWAVRYLKGFKWRDLTEQIANENKEREVRLMEEVRRTREENKRFVEDVQRGKMVAGREKKAKEKGKGQSERAEDDSKRRKSEFKQKGVKVKEKVEGGEKGGEELKRVLGKIF
jgi:ESF2/ABP1 family protein